MKLLEGRNSFLIMGFKNDGATLGRETRFLLPEGDSRSLEMCIYNKEETHSKRTKKEDPHRRDLP
jgi:hypothetical protein